MGHIDRFELQKQIGPTVLAGSPRIRHSAFMD
jgi:hypothetical protein